MAKPDKRTIATRRTTPETLDGQIVAMNEFGDGEIHGHKRTIKVARAVAGDQVRVRLPPGDKSYVYAELLKLIKPSAKRVDPACAAFLAGCGGCQWLHFDYAEQLRWKTRILREILKQRCPPLFPVSEILAMEQPLAFRNKLSLRVVGGRFVGMQEFGDQPVAMAQCRVETPANQAALAVLNALTPPRDLLQAHLRSDENGGLGICLFVARAGPALREFAQGLMGRLPGLVGVGAQAGDSFELLAGLDHIEYRGSGLTYQIPLNGFFQTNYRQARSLCDIALEQLAPGKVEAVLDLYCGCGFFSLPLAKRSRLVCGIENNAASTATATANATRNGIGNVEFQTADVAAALRGLSAGEWQAVLLDPPRQGCDGTVLHELLRLAPRRIVYVSCSPSALARDLKILLSGGYAVDFCQPLDMFPHTAHMEIVVTLNRGR